MKCRTCCFNTILEPTKNSRYNCVRNPPVYMKDKWGSFETMFPQVNPDWWCGEWKPKGFIKVWPENLTKEFN